MLRYLFGLVLSLAIISPVLAGEQLSPNEDENPRLGGTIIEMHVAPHGSSMAVSTTWGGLWIYEWAEDNVDWKTLEPYALSARDEDIYPITWSPDGTYLAYVSSGEIHLWDSTTKTEKVQWKAHDDFISKLAWSPDGTVLASASFDNTVRLWDVSTQSAIAILETTDSLQEIAWSYDGTLMASLTHRRVLQIWNVATQEVTEFPARYITAFAWSPTNTRLAYVDSDYDLGGNITNTIYGWDILNAESYRLMDEEFVALRELEWSPDGIQLAIAPMSGQVLLWNVAESAVLHRIEEPITVTGDNFWLPDSLLWSDEGDYIVSSLLEGTIWVWDAQSGEQVWALAGHESPVRGLAWAADGDILLSIALTGEIRVWDNATGEEIAMLDAHL